MSKKKLLTEDTRLELLNDTEKELLKRSKSLDSSSKLLLNVRRMTSTFNISKPEIEELLKLLEFKILINFISLDLTSCTRAYLKADYQYEGVFALKQFMIIINEGYKKIYNFKTVNSKGEQIVRNRNNSFWVKNIGGIVIKNPHLLCKYNEITKELDDFFDNNFEGIKEQRDLSVHYDDNLIKVYQMLLKLNGENIFKKTIPFYKLLNKMFIFTHELIMSYQQGK